VYSNAVPPYSVLKINCSDYNNHPTEPLVPQMCGKVKRRLGIKMDLQWFLTNLQERLILPVMIRT